MKYNRALITGGAGLIGSHIADQLVSEGIKEIVVLDNFTRGREQNLAVAAASGRVTIVDGDIRDMQVGAGGDGRHRYCVPRSGDPDYPVCGRSAPGP